MSGMLSGRRAVVIVCHQQIGFLAHRVLAPVRGFQFGGALTSSLSQFGGALTEPAIRRDCGYSAALTGDRF